MQHAQIIVPKNYVPTSRIWRRSATNPRSLYFLIGPVRGGGGWQKTACDIVFDSDPFATVAVPCRWDASHSLQHLFRYGDLTRFPRQLAWERHYIYLAALAHKQKRAGCVIAYLPLESETDPHPGPEPYGMDTRGELGELRMLMKYEGAKLVMGGHSKFYGISQIQRNFSAVLGFDFPIHRTLEDTVRTACALARD